MQSVCECRVCVNVECVLMQAEYVLMLSVCGKKRVNVNAECV